jgi:hypothetical protein
MATAGRAAAAAAEVLPSFYCSISLDVMVDPVSTSDGHCYDRAFIEEWFAAGETTSPKTGLELESTTLIPNLGMRTAIDEWAVAHGREIPRGSLTPDTFNHATQIGTGSFKEVHKATLSLPGAPKPIVVAVLKVRMGSMAAEAEVLLRLGRHPNLVRCIGLCKEGPDELMVTEFAERGALDGLVSAMRACTMSPPPSTTLYIHHQPLPPTSHHAT